MIVGSVDGLTVLLTRAREDAEVFDGHLRQIDDARVNDDLRLYAASVLQSKLVQWKFAV